MPCSAAPPRSWPPSSSASRTTSWPPAGTSWPPLWFPSSQSCSPWRLPRSPCSSTDNTHLRKTKKMNNGMTTTENLPRRDDTVNDVAKLERLKVLNNGEKVTLTFSDAEFERRLAGLRSIMAEKDLDAVVLTSYHSIKYYSDFLFTYFGRSYAMVVTKDDTVTVTANIDAGMPWRRSYGDNVVYTDWRRDNYIFAIQEALRTRGTTATRSRRPLRGPPWWMWPRRRCASG